MPGGDSGVSEGLGDARGRREDCQRKTREHGRDCSMLHGPLDHLVRRRRKVDDALDLTPWAVMRWADKKQPTK